MKWKALLLPLLLAGCDNAEMSSDLKGSYGSLSFDGQVERSVEGENYVYLVKRLDLTFHPEARSNATDKVVNPSLRFVAIEAKGDGTPQKILFESMAPIKANLDSSKRSAAAGHARFVVPRDFVDNADHVGFAVVDERLMWPIEADLKG
jgi:hypothetical protein